MSKVFNELRAEDPAPASFYLRTDDGIVYGPIDRETLCRWAAEGPRTPRYRA